MILILIDCYYAAGRHCILPVQMRVHGRHQSQAESRAAILASCKPNAGTLFRHFSLAVTSRSRREALFPHFRTSRRLAPRRSSLKCQRCGRKRRQTNSLRFGNLRDLPVEILEDKQVHLERSNGELRPH